MQSAFRVGSDGRLGRVRPSCDLRTAAMPAPPQKRTSWTLSWPTCKQEQDGSESHSLAPTAKLNVSPPYFYITGGGSEEPRGPWALDRPDSIDLPCIQVRQEIPKREEDDHLDQDPLSLVDRATGVSRTGKRL